MDEIKNIEKKIVLAEKLSPKDKSRIKEINKQIKQLNITKKRGFREYDPDIFLQRGGKVYRRAGGAIRGWGAATRGY